MVSPVSTTTTDATQQAESLLSATTTSGKDALGKDAFLKLLVAQISQQDPLKPMDDTTFVAQLAQFSSLEQTIGINTRLDSLAAQERGMANTSMAAVVGKSVTVKGSIVSLQGGGVGGVPVAFTLGSDAKTVEVKITDGSGRLVRTIQAGAKPQGLVKVNWDGRDDKGLSQPPGAYSVSVDAKGAEGGAVEASLETSGLVRSISFDQGYPSLQLDNGVTAPASDLLRMNADSK